MEEAIAACASGVSMRKASLQFNVKKSTLHDRIRGKSSRTGRPPHLSSEHERLLEEYVTTMASTGFSLTRGLCQTLAKDLSERATGKPCQELDIGWWRGFKRRCPAIVTKSAHAFENPTTRKAIPAEVTRFYDVLEENIAEQHIGPGQIWNVGQKDFDSGALPEKAVACITSAGQTLEHKSSRAYVITNVCVNACGTHLPPQVIFNNMQPAITAQNGPPGAIYSTSADGSMDSGLFITWFREIFLPGTSREKAQLVIMDNHASHINMELLVLARKTNVVFLALPRNTTDIMHPLAAAVFKSLAEQYQSASDAARRLKNNQTLVPEDFAPIFAGAFPKAVNPVDILSGFKVTGVYPVDRAAASTVLPALTEDERQLYKKRLQEGYDLPDLKYEQWRASQPSQACTPQITAPLSSTPGQLSPPFTSQIPTLPSSIAGQLSQSFTSQIHVSPSSISGQLSQHFTSQIAASLSSISSQLPQPYTSQIAASSSNISSQLSQLSPSQILASLATISAQQSQPSVVSHIPASASFPLDSSLLQSPHGLTAMPLATSLASAGANASSVIILPTPIATTAASKVQALQDTEKNEPAESSS